MGWFGRSKRKNDDRYICSDEDFVYGKEADKYPDTLKLMYAQERGRVLFESIDLISKTVYPKTFFSRYKTAIREAKTIIRLSKGYDSEKEMKKILDELYDSKSEIFNDFFNRCDDAGKLPFVKDEIIAHRAEIPEDSYEFFEGLLDCLTDEYDEEEYIFCSVIFAEGGRTYYYLTNEDDIRCGDFVLVPVGKAGRTEKGRVIKIEVFKGNNAPIPVESLKYIIERVK